MGRLGRGFSHMKVTDRRADEVMSRDEAAYELGVSTARVAWLAFTGHLKRAGAYHITRESVRNERRWRDTASIWSKCLRLLGDAIGFL